MKILLTRLQQRIGYQFSDVNYLHRALSHRSVGSNNNERLEFLGDAILGFVVTDILYRKFDQVPEGQLSRLRSSLVKGETLAELAREFELGECLILGEGEMKSGGFRRASILADAVEAILGAIYLDAGLDACRHCIERWFASRLATLEPEAEVKDPKTRLQEWLQAKKQPLPSYELVSISGPPHDQQFLVSCTVKQLAQAVQASGSSRRKAEREAARRVLAQLEKYHDGF